MWCCVFMLVHVRASVHPELSDTQTHTLLPPPSKSNLAMTLNRQAHMTYEYKSADPNHFHQTVQKKIKNVSAGYARVRACAVCFNSLSVMR